jgi:hypothetical protein
MLKKTALFTLALGILILLWGCPYKSHVAVGDAIEKTQQQMMGFWVPEGEVTSENPSYYVIEAYDSTHYAIEHFQFNKDEDGYTSKNYVAHTTYIDGLMFMNMVESGTKEYLMHRIDFVPAGLVLYQVTDNIDEKFDSVEKMRAFFQKNMRLSFFYNKDEVSLVKKLK